MEFWSVIIIATLGGLFVGIIIGLLICLIAEWQVDKSELYKSIKEYKLEEAKIKADAWDVVKGNIDVINDFKYSKEPFWNTTPNYFGCTKEEVEKIERAKKLEVENEED